jgi:hypothetical protein
MDQSLLLGSSSRRREGRKLQLLPLVDRIFLCRGGTKSRN